MDSDVSLILRSSGLDEDVLDSVVQPYLSNVIGIKSVHDLEFLEEKDIFSIDNDKLTVIEKRKLLKSIKKDWEGSAGVLINSDDEADDTTVSVQFMVYGTTDGMSTKDMTIDDIVPTKVTLNDLMNRITERIKIEDDEMIELYSKDGYPLHNNNITNLVPFQKWRLKDDFVFALIRKAAQPRQQQFATLPALDHDIGEETFIIETPHHEPFTVNAYMDSDSPEDIAQKIFSLTNIPVPYMSLYVRRGCNHERLNPFTELQDNDVIRVTLRDPHELICPQSNYYGFRSYSPMVEQTDLGLSKFYSILKFLCCPQSMNPDYDIEKLLSYLLELTGFPPLVYSLRVLFEQSHLSIPGWVALFEGCFVLFKKIISAFGTVPDNEVFELCDYIWAYLIDQSKSVMDTATIEFEDVPLVCPLSGTRILTPVRIRGIPGVPFDRDNVLEALKTPGTFSDIGYDQIADISETDLSPDNETQCLLLYFPWEHTRKAFKWRKELKMTEICKDIIVHSEWFELPSLLTNLSIVNPSGLFAGNECLTYIDQGRLVYFLGASKGDDEHRRLYDPINDSCQDYQSLIKKDQLERYGRASLERAVTRDLSSIASNPNSYLYRPQSEQERINAITQPHETMQWDPQEAIVVLLDYSGSMDSPIYHETGSLRCIDAAKELFNAFVTRTQAYRLHHCFGLTLFSTYVTVKLPVTKNTEEFEMSLRDVHPEGRTSLTDAVINGIQQLQCFTCTRRLICLTDGHNTSRTYSYDQVLDFAIQNNVIIDTVLITGPEGNEQQKRLSHDTGGVCVLPLTMNQALRFFEMDTMLSTQERSCTGHHSKYATRRYETEKDFVSKAIQNFRSMRTTSAKRFSTSVQSTNCHRRIMKELREILQTPHPSFKIFPTCDRCDVWKVLMKGPSDTAYKDGVFIMAVTFPDKYPSIPPEIRFLTQIYHCNISRSSGRVCHAILGSGYTPATSMRDILSHIYGLLMCPDIDTPLDSTLVDEYGYLRHKESNPNKPFPHHKYFGEADEYFDNASHHVQMHANQSFEQLEQDLDELVIF